MDFSLTLTFEIFPGSYGSVSSKDFQTLISECHLITYSRKTIITGECTLITKIAMLVVSSGTMVANSLYIAFQCSRSEWLTGMPVQVGLQSF